MNDLFQWQVNGAWRRGRKALVDGHEYSIYGEYSDEFWLMRLDPTGELTWARDEDLQPAPPPGPTKEEGN